MALSKDLAQAAVDAEILRFDEWGLPSNEKWLDDPLRKTPNMVLGDSYNGIPSRRHGSVHRAKVEWRKQEETNVSVVEKWSGSPPKYGNFPTRQKICRKT